VAQRKGKIVALLLALTVLLYLFCGLQALSPTPVMGKISPAQVSLYRNGAVRAVVDALGLSSRNLAKLYSLALSTFFLIILAYFIILYISHKYDNPVDIKTVLLVAGACSAILVLVPPILSRDIYSMIFYGKMESYYGLNPYLTSPQHLVSDPLLALISGNWKNTGMVYGPVSGMLCSLSYLLWGNNITANALFLKTVMAACHLVNIYLVWRIASRIKGVDRDFAALVYGLNPLVILHSAGGAHVDVLMMTLALLALDRYQRERYFDCVCLLLLSCCVKYVTVIPTLMTVVIILRRRPLPSQKVKTALAYAAAAAVILGVFYLPYFDGPGIFKPILTNLRISNVTSTGFYLKGAFTQLLRLLMLPPGAAAAIGGALASALLASLLLLVLYHLLLDFDNDQDLGKTWFWALFALLLTSSYVLPWYFIWVIALLPFRRWDRLSAGVLLFSTLAFFFAVDIWL
jgi:hypothetical protein